MEEAKVNLVKSSASWWKTFFCQACHSVFRNNLAALGHGEWGGILLLAAGIVLVITMVGKRLL
jgi:hypothetical protein